MSPEQARIIAYKQQVAAGNVIPWTYQLTEKWKAYSELEPRSRAKFRYAKHNNMQYDDVQRQDGKVTKKKKIRF